MYRTGFLSTYRLRAMLPLDTVVQAYRFNIYEEVDCVPFTWNTPPAYSTIAGLSSRTV